MKIAGSQGKCEFSFSTYCFKWLYRLTLRSENEASSRSMSSTTLSVSLFNFANLVYYVLIMRVTDD